jgi:hypothetical protein
MKELDDKIPWNMEEICYGLKLLANDFLGIWRKFAMNLNCWLTIWWWWIQRTNSAWFESSYHHCMIQAGILMVY